MVQCFRETEESPIVTWLAASRPSDNGPSVTGANRSRQRSGHRHQPRIQQVSLPLNSLAEFACHTSPNLLLSGNHRIASNCSLSLIESFAAEPTGYSRVADRLPRSGMRSISRCRPKMHLVVNAAERSSRQASPQLGTALALTQRVTASLQRRR